MELMDPSRNGAVSARTGLVVVTVLERCGAPVLSRNWS